MIFKKLKKSTRQGYQRSKVALTNGMKRTIASPSNLRNLKKKGISLTKLMAVRPFLLLQSETLIVVTAVPIMYLSCAIMTMRVNRERN